MEPESSRQSPTDVGCTERPDLRQETPGREEAKGADGSAVVPLRRRGRDEDGKDGKSERGACAGESEDLLKSGHQQDAAAAAADAAAPAAAAAAGKYEEELDPRIQEELEHLNQASDEINKLELHLDDARSSYRKILTHSARKLNAQGSQLGACIEKARPYYEARRLAKEAQQETQKAALRYERAVSMHTAAREMVYVAEQGLLADRNTLDPTWQEMLNHATAKVNEAEEERFRSEHEHQRVTQLCQDAEAKVQTLQKSLKKVILKSKPYFELKAQFNHILEEHKAKVVKLEEQVAKVKTRYSVALRNLEQISEQIHAQRGPPGASRGRPAACGGARRGSPVGAESRTASGGGSLAGGMAQIESDWLDGEKTRLWVEKHRQNGWGQREAASDRLSPVISLQTIASDLEKCDSVEHLGDFSDGALADEWDWNRKAPLGPATAGGHEAKVGKIQRPLKQTGRKEKQDGLVSRHHRSVSL
ncbi:SH3 domain-binding protein 5-like isoform X1 [Syngnathus acus]|uniref:SH3 domain-binding protein 5-like isoform X1 n=1 Tax=Syngnathus acus TaxID=161584 RepID=UPI001885EAA9|nr:SH3 domain-binding protein 5-like isoform X1 [Syngnathus acus]